MRLKNVPYIICRLLPQVGYIDLTSRRASGIILSAREEPFRRFQEPTARVNSFLGI